MCHFSSARCFFKWKCIQWSCIWYSASRGFCWWCLKSASPNFPNLAKERDFQEVQEAQRVPKKLDPRRKTPRHIRITLPKIKQKERILEAAREKDIVTYKVVPIRLSADFSKETLQARRGWQEVFQVMKGKDLHPRLLYPAKLSFRMEGQCSLQQHIY